MGPFKVQVLLHKNLRINLKRQIESSNKVFIEHILRYHIRTQAEQACARCGTDCHDSACMHTTAISFQNFCPTTPPTTLERPFLLQDPQASLSDLISAFQHSKREKRQYVISKTCFCYISVQVSSLFRGVWDFRNKSQDHQHAIAATPCPVLPLASEHRLCYPLECRRERVK